MSYQDKTIEQLCRESKKQRKDDERRGYIRAVRRMRRFAEDIDNGRPWLHVDDIMAELKKMEKSC